MTTYRRMVALGSSFAAGPGIDPVLDRAAGRSGRNYPHLVAERLGAHLTDATVSGATTVTILDTGQRVGVRRFPRQIDAVTTDTDLVTVTAGGNDLGYLGAVVSTALLGRMADRRLTRPLARVLRASRPLVPVTDGQEEAAAAGLARVVGAVRDQAPGVRVVLVDYLPIFTDDVTTGEVTTDEVTTGARGPFRSGEVAHFRGVASALSRALWTAADRSGADLVPASAFGPGRRAASSGPLVNGVQPVRRSSSSFHPTAAGMAVVADAVLERLDRAPATSPG